MTAVGRVTSQQLYASSQASISLVKSRLSALQEQASSGLVINRPSDDPTGAATVLRLRSDLAANSQYRTNIQDGLSWLSTADSALSTSESLVRKASDLAIQAANSATTSPAAREAIAVQLEGIKADLLGQANTQYLGRSVFAGTSDAARAFAADGTYSGVVDSTTGAAVPVQRRISATETVTVGVDGAAAFGTPATTTGAGTTPDTSVFSTLDAIVGALRSASYGTDTTATGPQATITAGIDGLKSSLTRLAEQHAVVGSAYARLDTAKTRNTDTATTLQQQRSAVQDADTASVLLDLKTQELAYQTALGVTAQVLQPTLMSFLR